MTETSTVLWWLLIATVVLGLGVFLFLMLLGPSSTFKNTRVHTAYLHLTVTLPALLTRLAHRLLGPRIVSWCTRCAHWIGYERNPLVQIFFLALVTAGVGIFAYSGWHRLEPLGFSHVHKWAWSATVFACFGSYFAACRADPGTIKSKAEALAWSKVWPCDNVLYWAAHECRTCLFEKPARSKHCSLCKACIARNDHHCVWINQCVGNANQPHFIAFLVSTTWIAAYTTYLSLAVAVHDLAKHGWIEFGKKSWWDLQCYRFGYQQTGRWVRYPVDWVEGFSLALLIDPALMALGLFLIFATLIVAGFLAHHLWLNVIRGTTTNESHKWADVHDAIKYNEVCFVRDAARGGRIVLTDVHNVKDEADLVTDKAQWPRHVYRAGVWTNLMEVLRPRKICVGEEATEGHEGQEEVTPRVANPSESQVLGSRGGGGGGNAKKGRKSVGVGKKDK